jgi:hypothetical protein
MHDGNVKKIAENENHSQSYKCYVYDSKKRKDIFVVLQSIMQFRQIMLICWPAAAISTAAVTQSK